jgi:putative heme-binding domain-containing protein
MIQDRLLDAGMRGKLLRFAAMHPNSVASETLTEVLKDLTNNVPMDNAFRDVALDLGIASATNDDIQRLKAALPKLKIEFQASIAERMCQREPSASALLGLVADGTLRKELLSPNRVRLLAATGSADAKSLVTKIWGTVNAESSREREEVIRRVADELRWDARGSAERGWLVYDRICGQCHLMHGRGVEVGPNITANGRGSHEQLLVSVFNPSLVIGEAYRSVTIRTDDGTVITGLLVSREDDKTVVKIQGGKEVTVPAAEIEVFQQDKKSLMPEGIENQLNEQELADLFALLTLEKAPGSPDNATIQGTPQYLHQPKK